SRSERRSPADTRASLRPRLGKARLGRTRPGLRHLARRSTLPGVAGKAQIIELARDSGNKGAGVIRLSLAGASAGYHKADDGQWCWERLAIWRQVISLIFCSLRSRAKA